jgi:hypothetical protein
MIRVIGKFEDNPYGGVEVDTTSRGSFKTLSPFFLGPYRWDENSWFDGTPVEMRALNVENLWQYSKVYPQYIGPNGGISPEYFEWRQRGFNNYKPTRYPMGKGKVPEFSYWHGEGLDYITARKKIYIPAYASLVIKTKAYAQLYDWVMQGMDVTLRDFDGYDYRKMGMTLAEVANNPKRVMGHAFVLAGLLTGTINDMMQ